MPAIEDIRCSDIVLDPACQPRVDISVQIVEEYAEAMQRGDEFPAIIVFKEDREAAVDRDGKRRIDGTQRYFLADGFYRTASRQHAGHATIKAEIHPGT